MEQYMITNEQHTWAESVRARLQEKMPCAIEKALALEGIPYSVEDGEWKESSRGITWWTNGFWPALMWRMSLLTGDVAYRLEAMRAENLLDKALSQFEKLHHDVGFQWRISAGVHYDLDGNPASLRRTLLAASLLAGRMNPNGFIRAWNGEDNAGWSIIDTMMNLPLLYWASEHTGDPRFRLTAMRHADGALKHFFREDGSVHHIVIYDPESGEVLETPRGQGYAPCSSWSRGQAWAIYGFALSYRHTGKQEYLDASRRVADYFLAHMPEDNITPCDFVAPETPIVKDNCAGCVAVCGLMELAGHLGEEGKEYLRRAAGMLQSIEAEDIDWSRETPSLVRRCTSAYHSEAGRHIHMVYADYFFVEAVARLLGEETLFW